MTTILTLLAAGLLSGKSYYVVMFAHEKMNADGRPDPHFSHTFATWVEADDDGVIGETFTISWTGIHGVKFLRGAQPGRNLDLQATFDRACRRGVCVTMWGPYRCCESMFKRAKCEWQMLEHGEATGSVTYTVVDALTRSKKHPSINCIHAVSDVGVDMLRTGTKHGTEVTSYIIDEFFACGVIEPHDPENDWVWEAIKEDNYVVQRR